MMHEHVDDEQLQDYLDGLLTDRERAGLEAHLRACAACSDALAHTADVITALGALPDAATPPRDLWPGIRERLEGDPSGPAVIEFPGARTSTRRRLSFSIPQLVAAGVALAFVSGASVWLALRPDSRAVEAVPPAPEARLASSGGMVADARLEGTITELEATLEAARDLLDPATVATVEESLRSIDEAIAEARRALNEDPASPLLGRLLRSHQRAKVRILRQATVGLIRI